MSVSVMYIVLRVFRELDVLLGQDFEVVVLIIGLLSQDCESQFRINFGAKICIIGRGLVAPGLVYVRWICINAITFMGRVP